MALLSPDAAAKSSMSAIRDGLREGGAHLGFDDRRSHSRSSGSSFLLEYMEVHGSMHLGWKIANTLWTVQQR
jgi:hypothetical protein